MNRKKLTGQTISIIILAVLLLLSIGFGVVYAYYSAKSSAISGKIVMANLNISIESGIGASGKSEIVISNSTNIMPNQQLENTPLLVHNSSSVPIYLVVVYKIQAFDTNNEEINDPLNYPVLDIGCEFINPTTKSSQPGGESIWTDFVFTYEKDDTISNYRCFVSSPIATDTETVTVIEENKLRISRYMGNEYQKSTIYFTFQAYAIGCDSFNADFPDGTTIETKCQKIVSAIYEAHNMKFLNV